MEKKSKEHVKVTEVFCGPKTKTESKASYPQPQLQAQTLPTVHLSEFPSAPPPSEARQCPSPIK